MEAKVQNKFQLMRYTEQQKAYEYRDLDWDTDYFGVKSARVTLKEKLNKEEWLSIRSLIIDNEFVVIDNVNNNPTNNFFISNLQGVFLTDINFQFTKAIEKIKINTLLEGFNIYITRNMNYNKQIIDISKNSYEYSRFFNDPFLEKSKSQNIYSHWVESSFLKDNKYFLSYHEGSNILGYILFVIDRQNKNAVIELISVHESMKDKSIGTKMIKFLESYLSENFKEIEVIKVGTQSNNIRAINFYTKNGFRVKEIRSIYHYWPNFMVNNMAEIANDKVVKDNL